MKLIRLRNCELTNKQLVQFLAKHGLPCDIIDIQEIETLDQLQDSIKSKATVEQLEEQIGYMKKIFTDLTKRVRGFFKMDIITGKYLLVDKFLAELSGYPISAWKETPHFIRTIIHPDYQDEYHSFLRSLDKGKVPSVLEYKIIRQDDEECYWIQFNIGAYDIDGQLVSISSVIIDDTENAKTREKYQNLFENINAGIFRIDSRTGQFLEANKKMVELLGYSSVKELKESITKTSDYLETELKDEIVAKLRKGVIADYEIPMTRKDQKEIWFSLSAKFFPKEGFIEGIVVDITERREAERKLQENKEKFRALAEQSVAGIVIIKDNKITFANDIISKHSGYKPEELMAFSLEKILTIIHPEDQHIVTKNLYQAQKNGLVPEFFFRLYTKKGDLIWVSAQVKKMEYNDETAITAIIVEQTQRIELEQRIKEERDLAQKYFDIADVLLMVLDRDFNVKQINKRGSEILGYQKEEIIGKNWVRNFLPKRIQQGVHITLTKALEGKISQDDCFENYILTKSGEERIISWHNAIIRDDNGEITGIISSGEDITERKKAEQLLNKKTIIS